MKRPPANDRPSIRRDAGATFIEVLVATVLLGTAGIAVLAALQTSITGARTHDRVAQNQAVLAEAADWITDTDPAHVSYVDCGNNPEVAYQTALDGRFSPGTVTVAVENWDRTAGTGGAFVATCNYANGDRLQRLTLVSVVGGTSRQLVVVKRPTTIPTQDTIAAPPVPPFSGGSGQAIVSPTPGING